jgi:hypothetical protein
MAIRIDPWGPEDLEIEALSRINDLKSRLRERDEIEFHFRGGRRIGTVVSLGPRFVEVAFQSSGKRVVQRVPYERIIGILS